MRVPINESLAAVRVSRQGKGYVSAVRGTRQSFIALAAAFQPSTKHGPLRRATLAFLWALDTSGYFWGILNGRSQRRRYILFEPRHIALDDAVCLRALSTAPAQCWHCALSPCPRHSCLPLASPITTRPCPAANYSQTPGPGMCGVR